MNNNKEANTKQRVVVIKDVFRVDSSNKISEFNGYHAIAYMGIQTFYHPMVGSNMLSLAMLYEIMGISNTRTQRSIKEAVEDLMEWGLITMSVDKFNSNTLLMVNIPMMSGDNSCRFTTINKQYVWEVLTSNYSIQEKGNMLLVYGVLAQYMGNKQSAFPSLDKIEEDSSLTRKTIIKAINNLVEMKILYYGNYGYKVGENNQVKKHNNIYIFRDIQNADLLYSKIATEDSTEQ